MIIVILAMVSLLLLYRLRVRSFHWEILVPACGIILASAYVLVDSLSSIDLPNVKGVFALLSGLSAALLLLKSKVINARMLAGIERKQLELWLIGPLVVLGAILMLADLLARR